MHQTEIVNNYIILYVIIKLLVTEDRSSHFKTDFTLSDAKCDQGFARKCAFQNVR